MNILAVGDSHMDYPGILGTGGGIPDHLSALLGTPIKNIAHHGDGGEVTLSLMKTIEIEQNLLGTDVMLVSMGGDDIVGPQFRIWLNDNHGDITQAVAYDRLNPMLDLIMAYYEDLEDIRDNLAPNCLIVTYEYDFPPPDVMGKGVCELGPWLQPSLNYCGWSQASDQAAITKTVLSEFSKRLSSLPIRNRIHVKSQGTCSVEDWVNGGNEIHYGRTGFEKIAQKFKTALAGQWLHNDS